jgi:hypothetical protein
LTDSDQIARSAPTAEPSQRRVLTAWRLVILLVLAFIAVGVVTAPLWAGYFGPRAAVYAAVWRPWRSDVRVAYLDAARGASPATGGHEPWPQRLDGYVGYSTHDGGWDVTVERSSSSTPWRVRSLTPYEGP